MLDNTSLDDFDIDFDDNEIEDVSLSEKAHESNEVEKANEVGVEAPKEVEKVDEVEEENKKELLLYIITDKYKPGMLDYFRGFGINVSQIFTSLEEARDALVMQVEPSRVIILETGTGKFTSMLSRNILIDLLGICDEDTEIAIFYTDSVIKTEVKESLIVDTKMLDWFKYKSTVDVVANILQLSKEEKYVYDSNETKTDKIDIDNVLDFKGLSLGTKEGQIEIDLGLPAIKADEIRLNMMENDNTEDLIKGYKIRI